ncbi:MAG: hypothetical protein VB934_18405 [Polyangiaceae bacterium]
MRTWLPGVVFLTVCVACSGESETAVEPGGTGVYTGATTVVASSGSAVSSSSSSTSSAGGASSSSGAGGMASTGTSSVSSTGAGGAPSCVDTGMGEPNENEGAAHTLPKVTDKDSTGGTLSGVIKADQDVDWYTYEAEDVAFATVDPTRAISQTQSGLRLCKYFECLNGLDKTEVVCKGGSMADMSPSNRPGCCHTDGFEVDLNCKSTISDDTFVFLRVDQPGAKSTTCNEYVISYHY